jgi:spore photoproduct lyase
MFSEFENKIKILPIRRIGTGELSDSLLLDPFTGYSKLLKEFFQNFKDVYFEFKTKTSNIDLLLEMEGKSSIVTGFSLNTFKVMKYAESLTSPITTRITNAKKLIEKGYSVSFHFDPIFIYENADNEYIEILKLLKQNIPYEKVAWFSIGSFRYHPDMKEILRNNYKEEFITKQETIIGKDGKIRYFTDERQKIYSIFYEFIEKKWPVPLYMCMESKKMWYNIFKDLPYNIDKLTNIFKM